MNEPIPLPPVVIECTKLRQLVETAEELLRDARPDDPHWVHAMEQWRLLKGLSK